jgi:hypothetical protein
MQMTGPVLIAIAVVSAAIVALIAAALIWAAAASRRQRADHASTLAGLGYHVVEAPSAALLDGLAALQPNSAAPRPSTRYVARRITPDGELTVLDAEMAGEGGLPWLGGGTLAAVMPGLSTPRLALLPGTVRNTGALAHTALLRALDLFGSMSGMARVAFSDDVEFDDRYVVLSDDEGAAYRFLTGARRTALLDLPEWVAVTAGGDLLVLSMYPPQRASSQRLAKLQDLNAAAERLLAAMT